MDPRARPATKDLEAKANRGLLGSQVRLEKESLALPESLDFL